MKNMNEVYAKAKKVFDYHHVKVTMSDQIVYLKKGNGIFAGSLVINICEFCTENELIFIVADGVFQICPRY